MKKFISSYPELVKEWHPTKNGEKQTNDVSQNKQFGDKSNYSSCFN